MTGAFVAALAACVVPPLAYVGGWNLVRKVV